MNLQADQINEELILINDLNGTFKSSIEGQFEFVKSTFKDISLMMKNVGKFYTVRQILVSKKLDVMNKITHYNIILNEQKKDHLSQYKTNKKSSPVNQHLAITLSNDTERNIFLDADTSQITEIVSMYNNILEYINHNIKMCDQLIYSIETHIEYSKIKNIL